MKIVSKYRIYCNTESIYTYIYKDTTPTACPNNNTHTIDTNTISIIDNVKTNDVNIIQEIVPTNGNYRGESKKMTISQVGKTTEEIVFDQLISVLTITPHATSENHDDSIYLLVTPNTPVGVNTQDSLTSDTVMYVNSTVIENMQKGYYIYIIKNNVEVEVGKCLDFSSENSTITINTPLTEDFTAGSYIGINIYLLYDFILLGGAKYELARKTIGCSSVETNLIVKIIYDNKSVEPNKSFYYHYEYLY